MQKQQRSAGFTLIEVTLAIALGIVVIAGGIVLYNQANNSARDASAKERLTALSSVVESAAMQTNGGTYPTVANLRSMWQRARPNDYNVSPWGGTPAGTNFIDGNDNITIGTVIGDGEAGGWGVGTKPTQSDRGRIYYFRVQDSLSQFWIDDFSQVASGTTRVEGYGIGYSGPNKECWYFVTGKNATNAPGTGPGGSLSGGAGG